MLKLGMHMDHSSALSFRAVNTLDHGFCFCLDAVHPARLVTLSTFPRLFPFQERGFMVQNLEV
jgi:hypothetical protein